MSNFLTCIREDVLGCIKRRLRWECCFPLLVFNVCTEDITSDLNKIPPGIKLENIILFNVPLFADDMRFILGTENILHNIFIHFKKQLKDMISEY